MSATIVTVPVTVTASESVVVVTSTIDASQLPGYTSVPTSSATASPSSSASGSGSSSSSSANASPTGNSSSSSNGSSTPIGAIVGGAVGGVALLALLIVLGCLYKKRSNAKKKAKNPFPDDEEEKGPAVIAGLPPNLSGSRLRPTSANYSNSIHMTDAGSSMPLLETDPSLYSGSQFNAAATASDARSAHIHRPSTTSLAPSFLMGSVASFPHSHGSHYAQPMNAPPINGQDTPAALAAAYPDVHRTAYYEPYVPPGVDPRAMPASALAGVSAAAAYHNASVASSMPGSPPPMMDARAHTSNSGVASLPMGAAPSDYAAASELARMRGVPQSGYVGDPAWSRSVSPTYADSRRGSNASALAMPSSSMQPPEASAHSHSEVESLQSRRGPAAGLAGYQTNLSTIPGSVAASEVASADQHSMLSGTFGSRGDRSVPPKLPSIPASSPLIVQDATSFAPLGSQAAGVGLLAAYGAAPPRMTTEPGTDTLQSSDPSNGGTFNSDGTYNTYTGAAKGQLRVVGGSNDTHGRGQPTIAEEDDHVKQPQRDMSGDSKTGEFWVDAPEKPQLGATGRRLGQHSANNSASSINKTGSRLIEMLDTDEQPRVPDSVTGGDIEVSKQTAAPTRPPFWKERSRSAQSITKVFRSSPLLNANNVPSPASAAQSRVNSQAAAALDSSREHLPPLDLGRSVTGSGGGAGSANANAVSTDSPKTDGDADMWKEMSKSKPSSALRKWTTKKTSKASSKQGGADNEVDVDELFS
ncbi:conserved hypothetical protein [Sporisorium reilianum SRZ2]|uniref:Uncharacterized protein n=1 Tax=Sporisorium reilianum (strain SRZ2) TaxID=999809 RepID=E7A397_SPORE|nr:conserved hypothetical protein [Sporisorium reilianum SRZ2]